MRSGVRAPEDGRHGHARESAFSRCGVRARTYDRPVPVYICPNCKNRSVDIDGFEGFSGSDALQCRRCGFGFIFQLLEDYYPAPSTGFIVCDRDARVLAAGRGVFELTGFQEGDLMGRDVGEALTLSDPEPIGVVREWGVRKLGLALELSTRAAIRKPVTVDLFPAYDEDGGLLVALTPRTTSRRRTRRGCTARRPQRAVVQRPQRGRLRCSTRDRGSIQSWRETASTAPSSP